MEVHFFLLFAFLCTCGSFRSNFHQQVCVHKWRKSWGGGQEFSHGWFCYSGQPFCVVSCASTPLAVNGAMHEPSLLLLILYLATFTSSTSQGPPLPGIKDEGVSSLQ